MRIREREPEAGVPDELVTFDPQTWRHRGGVAGWIAARRRLLLADQWPGDPVDALREHVAAKRSTLSAGPVRAA